MIMGKIKAGQIRKINGSLYRAKKRDPENLMSCTGCVLNNAIMCPNLRFTNTENLELLNCEADGLIFVKP